MERSLRNVLVVSLGFLLLFTAYGGLQNLQVGVCKRPGILPSERPWGSRNSRGHTQRGRGGSGYPRHPPKIL